MSAAIESPASPIGQIERFQGGRQWLVVGGGLGLLLVLASVAGLFMGDAADQRAAGASYLVGFAYWCGIAMASVILLMIFHATRAKWMVVLRRTVEIMAGTLPLFLVLFIPLVIALKSVYFNWADPPAGTSRETLRLLEHKRPWLNPGFFTARGFIFIGFISLVGALLYGW